MATPAPQQAPAPVLARTTPPVVIAQRPQSPPQALLAQAAEPVAASVTAMAVSTPEDTPKPVADTAPVKAKKAAVGKQGRSYHQIEHVADAGNRCARMGRQARARCMRPQLLRADRALRSAYASATRAGVDRKTLKSYRNRWSRVLEESNADPVYVTASLQEMTRRLNTKRTRL